MPFDSILFSQGFPVFRYYLLNGYCPNRTEIVVLTLQSVLIKGTDRLLMILPNLSVMWDLWDILLSSLFFLNEIGNRSFVYFSRNKHNRANRFVLKPCGKEKLEMLFYRFALTIFFLSCPSPRCLTVRHLIEGLAVSYQ